MARLVNWLVALGTLVLIIVMLVGGMTAQERRPRTEQSHFGAEAAITAPVEIPSDVIPMLRQDKRNQTCLKRGESVERITKTWFVCSEIHLKDDRSVDLVVTARNECLLGSNIVPFWVFRKTPHGHELVLSVSALGLDVLNSKTNNYRDIRIARATARSAHTATLKFDGRKYRPQMRM